MSEEKNKEKIKKRIQVGSNVFFNGFYDDFNPHDNDILILTNDTDGFSIQRQIRLHGNCYFEWKYMTPEQFIQYHKSCNQGLFLGKFLVPEFVREIGFSIENLKELEFLLPYLDPKHEYEKIVFEAYLANNDFILTPDQRNLAYEVYKKARS